MFRDSVLPGEDCPHAAVFPFPDERQADDRPCRAWLPAFLALHEGHPHHRLPSFPSFRATDRQAACAVLRCPARHRPRQQASLQCGGRQSCQHPDVPWGAPVCPSSCCLPFLQSAAARETVRRTCCLYTGPLQQRRRQRLCGESTSEPSSLSAVQAVPEQLPGVPSLSGCRREVLWVLPRRILCAGASAVCQATLPSYFMSLSVQVLQHPCKQTPRFVELRCRCVGSDIEHFCYFLMTLPFYREQVEDSPVPRR